MMFALGFICACLVFLVLLALEIRLQRRDSSVTQYLVRQGEKIIPRAKGSVIMPLDQKQKAWRDNVLNAKEDVNLNKLYDATRDNE